MYEIIKGVAVPKRPKPPICVEKPLKVFGRHVVIEDEDCYELALSNSNKVAIINHEDYHIVRNLKWFLVERGTDSCKVYYASTKPRICGILAPMLLHRLIMGAPKRQGIDHANRDGLDCRKKNLRFCDQTHNNANAKKRDSSEYKGVWYNGYSFMAYTSFRGKRIWLGSFSTAIEAAKAYNRKALELFGEFARINVIEDSI